MCGCAPGWSGPDCSIQNNCVQGILLNSNPPKCVCNPGYSGKDCSIAIPERIQVHCWDFSIRRGKSLPLCLRLRLPKMLPQSEGCVLCSLHAVLLREHHHSCERLPRVQV